MSCLMKALAAMVAMGRLVGAGSIKDIEHVVLFMQENRAFDHYFGTMAGVRGFKDPNVQTNSGTPVWYQKVNGSISNATDHLLPWYLNYLGGKYQNGTQCMVSGSNDWSANHDALNGGMNDLWAIGNTPYSWGYFTRKELPNHFAIAEGYTVADMYQEGVIASTSPNRVTWVSGTINAPGSPPGPNKGGMYIDNSETPGCESPGLNCYPLKWKTAPEYYQKAGVSWQVYQDSDNFDDNPLAWFQQFQKAAKGSPLASRGMQFLGLETFYEQAANGTLPQVSYIIGPAELSEHPPYQPKDGAWLQQRIVNAVTQSPAYNTTALIISYDETGGWGDHVVPFHSPKDTKGEWVQDPYGQYGDVYTGPGFRLPSYIISPWTRGGNVYVENVDHNSQILFVEEWLASKGYNVKTAQMNPWRRANMANMVKAFDFANPDYSIPSMPNASYPSVGKNGVWNGYAVCQAQYGSNPQPPVPYGKQTATKALQTEQGFKQMRGNPTEGRYLVFEMNGYALTNTAGVLTAGNATSTHSSNTQRFVLHQNATKFSVTSVTDNYTINGASAYMQKPGVTPSLLNITDLGNGQGYSIQNAAGKYFSISKPGRVTIGAVPLGFKIFSVTYDD